MALFPTHVVRFTPVSPSSHLLFFSWSQNNSCPYVYFTLELLNAVCEYNIHWQKQNVCGRLQYKWKRKIWFDWFEDMRLFKAVSDIMLSSVKRRLESSSGGEVKWADRCPWEAKHWQEPENILLHQLPKAFVTWPKLRKQTCFEQLLHQNKKYDPK